MNVNQITGECECIYVVVNFYFQLKFSFPLFLCMLMNGKI